ncbi:MAG: GH36-type glycosyl hydrolase domain-containing protein [Planctomycetota bacterium]|jgi:cellobiose phosphorylase
MKLSEIDLKGLGRFRDEKACFEVQRFFTPEPWDYIYTNSRILLRIRHNGTGYAQVDPPGGTVLFKMERFQQYPSFFVWVKPRGETAFSNFFKPHFDIQHPDREPEDYSCTFAPGKALYRIGQGGLRVETEVSIAPAEPAIIVQVTVTNEERARDIDVFPIWRPHNTSSALEPWDVPEMYQTCQYVNGRHRFIWIETRNPAGEARLRRRAVLLTDLEADGAEVRYDKFVGEGAFDLPQAADKGRLTIDARKKYRYLSKHLEHTAVCELPIAAFHKRLRLRKGESFSFRMVLAALPETPDGSMPPAAETARHAKYLKKGSVERAARSIERSYDVYQSLRSIDTPDEAFNRYINEWVPLQLRWVTLLDRGWPTGLRGSRDCAQDFTGLIPLVPDEARRVLLEIFSCQRTDGWFPRQFSTEGPEGKHDLRAYVDAGCWVWEFLYDYLRFTGDFGILDEQVRWLETSDTANILEHAKRIFMYYLEAENLGEHGLVKIRAGDWNDSVNAAGLEGRGESVMVSCQLVLALKQAAGLLAGIGEDGSFYSECAERIRTNVRLHALNERGYLNGVFTDNAEWVFSPRDPDGRARINSPVNSFGIIAGVFDEDEIPGVIAQLKTLKQANGYALFLPGIGDPPIQKLGRIGQGDLLPGVSENGNPYNHGSHGFLGRAAAAVGEGDFLADIFKYMLPYDQGAHPVDVSMTAPYGIVNHWMSIEGQFGRGGATFLSGSITTALRNVYGGMMGFRPELDGIRISPVLPSKWGRVSYTHNYRGCVFEVTIENDDAVQSGVRSLEVNGRPVEGDLIPLDWVNFGGVNAVRVVMGR